MKDNLVLYDREDDGEFFDIHHDFEERLFLETLQPRDYRDFGTPNAGVRLAAQPRDRRQFAMPRLD